MDRNEWMGMSQVVSTCNWWPRRTGTDIGVALGVEDKVGPALAWRYDGDGQLAGRI